MAGEKIGQAEFREIPDKFFTVIADDESYYADSTEKAIITGFSSGNKTHGGIYKAQDAIDLFRAALFGKDGDQADVILLDDRFEKNYESWKSKDEDLTVLANQASIDFTPYLMPDRSGAVFSGTMPDDLHRPNSTSFAILLRILGYKNNIFVVSGNPPTVEMIEREVFALAKHAPDHYKPAFPVNGFSIKVPYREEITYANSITDGIWNRIHIQGGLPQTLQKLFFNQSVK